MISRTAAMAWLGAAVLALPVVVWAIVGDVSEPAGEDVMVDLPNVPTPAVVFAFGVLVVAVVVVFSPAGRSHIGRRELSAAAPLAALALFAGLTARVVSARVTGANIGGAFLLVMCAPLFVPAMLALSVSAWRRDGCGRWVRLWRWHQLLARRHQRATSTCSDDRCRRRS